MTIKIIISLLISYIIGAIPFAVIIASANGKNIFEEGSKNPGSSNVLRVCGKKAGILCYFLDISKGAVAVLIPALFIIKTSDYSWVLILCAVFSILGHVYSVFLKFRGGKGVATAAGSMFMLAPVSLLITMIFFFAGLFVSKKTVAIGSTVGVIAFPLILTALNFNANFLYRFFFNVEYKYLICVAILLALFIIIKHIPNYKRMLKGEENSFEKK